MKPTNQVFESNVNGAKFDVNDPLTAELLSKSEKKEFVRRVRENELAKEGGKGKGKKADPEMEQEIA